MIISVHLKLILAGTSTLILYKERNAFHSTVDNVTKHETVQEAIYLMFHVEPFDEIRTKGPLKRNDLILDT